MSLFFDVELRKWQVEIQQSIRMLAEIDSAKERIETAAVCIDSIRSVVDQIVRYRSELNAAANAAASIVGQLSKDIDRLRGSL